MNDLTSQPWFGWTIGLTIGLPLALIVLTELHNGLVRRGSPLAAPVAMLRNFALPAGALLVLFTQVWELDDQATWVRILATVFGFLVLVLALSALNVVLFKQAGTGTWRERMPSIFIDIVRLVLVVTGLALIMSWVWGANVGGFFAALGVTSIVLGFALQNAVGSIISGLLLLFEQPFHLGDWLDAAGVRGRIVEVNWRSVHIETSDGVQIIPNATLAGASFTNLSQPAGAHTVTIASTFGAADPPDDVCRLLERVAGDISVSIEPRVSAAMTGPKAYATTIAVRSPADADEVTSTFHARLWYAARRTGLHLDGTDPAWATPDDVLAAVRDVATTLYLRTEEDIAAAAAGMSLERWAPGEVMQYEGVVPDGMRFIRRGHVWMMANIPGQGRTLLDDLQAGEYLGITALTRETITSVGIAQSEVEVLMAPQSVIEELVRASPALARDLGKELDNRRTHYRALMAAARGPARPAPALIAGG